LPAFLFGSDLRDGRLVPVLEEYQRSSHGLHVLYPSRQDLPLAVSAFMELVMEKLRDKRFQAQ
ncbi:LysR family transcriptional regulator, partial [Pseudomonas syringae pv. tagetis]